MVGVLKFMVSVIVYYFLLHFTTFDLRLRSTRMFLSFFPCIRSSLCLRIQCDRFECVKQMFDVLNHKTATTTVNRYMYWCTQSIWKKKKQCNFIRFDQDNMFFRIFHFLFPFWGCMFGSFSERYVMFRKNIFHIKHHILHANENFQMKKSIFENTGFISAWVEDFLREKVYESCVQVFELHFFALDLFIYLNFSLLSIRGTLCVCAFCAMSA